LISKNILQIYEIHKRTIIINNSNDYYCDIREEKLDDFENEMKNLGLKFSILEELPIIFDSPFVN
jgi:hypothetical protein